MGAGSAQGQFAGVQKIGKRLRIFVRRSGRPLLAFEVRDPVQGYFFIANRGQDLSLRYRVAQMCQPQIGEYQRVKILTSVALGKLTSTRWWRELQDAPGAAAAAAKAFTDYVEGPFRK